MEIIGIYQQSLKNPSAPFVETDNKIVLVNKVNEKGEDGSNLEKKKEGECCK